MPRTSFQQQLIHHRQAKALTQEQLGQLIGVEKQCISNYEQGTRFPDLDTLTQLGDVFNQDLFISGQNFLFVEAGTIDAVHPLDYQIICHQKIQHLQPQLPLTFGEMLQQLNLKTHEASEFFVFSTAYHDFIQAHLNEPFSTDNFSEMYSLLIKEPLMSEIMLRNQRFEDTFESHVTVSFEKQEEALDIKKQMIDFYLINLLSWGQRTLLTVEDVHRQVIQYLSLALAGFAITSVEGQSAIKEEQATLPFQLHRKRVEKGLTQESLAQSIKGCSLTAQAISLYENGSRQPQFEKLIAMLEALQCDMVIRKGGSVYIYDQTNTPVFFSQTHHAQVLEQYIQSLPIQTPSELWLALSDQHDQSQSYQRSYSNYLRPLRYHQVYQTYQDQPWTEEVKQALIDAFKGTLIDELWVTDVSSETEFFSTGFKFIYENPEKAAQRQQQGILELIEEIEPTLQPNQSALISFHNYFYEVFGGLVGDEKLKEIKILTRK